jgi:hypothetical protein
MTCMSVTIISAYERCFANVKQHILKQGHEMQLIVTITHALRQNLESEFMACEG